MMIVFTSRCFDGDDYGFGVEHNLPPGPRVKHRTHDPECERQVNQMPMGILLFTGAVLKRSEYSVRPTQFGQPRVDTRYSWGLQG